MGGTTVRRIVKETVEILWEELHPLHIPPPTTESLKNNAKEFENVWNFHVVGCVDGKHIRIICPTVCGAMFFKGYWMQTISSLLLKWGVSGNKAMEALFCLRFVQFHRWKKNNFSRTGLSPSQQCDSSVRNVRR